MIIEVIATSVEDAKRAEQGGADRLELISGILEGGITPSWGLIDAVVKAVRIPVNVMVRPHSQSFCYTQDELFVMREDVRVIRELGAAGVVVGMLAEQKKLDTNGLELVLSEADELDVTFHRAFDEADDQLEAARILLHYPQVRRILTSGGQKSAVEGVDCIAQLMQFTDKTQLNMLAGSGLSLSNITDFLQKTGVKEIHFGTGVREDGQALRYVDPEKVAALKGICEPFSKQV
ncbi:copper homeostasis protein CutC [Brevibacillus reuszeri]|uniref:copper homeostasis protein CutC n=1 Tax=Brevibacillus reuszeri TaxID=54915 RepID=UPI0028A13914|nr:copper homeostasis protein CutC [Brevibacillus reuszeri]